MRGASRDENILGQAVARHAGRIGHLAAPSRDELCTLVADDIPEPGCEL